MCVGSPAVGMGMGVVVGLGKIGLLIEPCICKGNVRAKWWESLLY